MTPPAPALEPFAGEGELAPEMMGPGMPMVRLKPEAREQMHKLMIAFREEIKGYQEQIFALEYSTVALLRHDPPPMRRVNDRLKQLADLRLLVNEKAVHNLLQAKKFLSPEEQEVFFRATMQARPQGMRFDRGMARGGMRGRGRRGAQGHYDAGVTQ